MLPVLTAGQMAQIDRYTIDQLGLDGKLLMSSAARETLRVMRHIYPAIRHPVIFAGTGNNGGDGVALAYYALQDGLSPLLVLCHPQIGDPPKLSEDSAYFHRIAERAYVPIRLLDNPVRVPELLTGAQADIVVDALFGTGLDRDLDGYYAQLVERINHTNMPLLAVDSPSGLNCTTGQVMGTAVEADLTVTMGFPKRGFFHPIAGRYTGDLHVVKLGFAPPSEAAITPESCAWPEAFWEPSAHPRISDSHKGDYGKLLIIAGHRRYPGAPRLAASAAVRMGAGLTRLVVPEDAYAVATDNPAVMTDAHATDGAGGFAAQPSRELLEYLHWADALVVGPGLGDAAGGIELTRRILAERDLPTVVDADGLRALPVETAGREWPLVLTPHSGELARMLDIPLAKLLANWFDVALKHAARHDSFVLAKSNQCMLATPEGALIFPRQGHPALATGGTGDVLSGIIGAMLARLKVLSSTNDGQGISTSAAHRLSLAEIITTAVNIHAEAALHSVARVGEESLSPVDLVDDIPAALQSLAGSMV